MDTRHQSNETERMLRQARAKVEQLVEQGETHAAAFVLNENPSLANDPESAIEIIYSEFLALESCGRLPESESWLDRFPSHRPQLERLLKLHDFLSTEQPASFNGLAGNAAVRDRKPEQDIAAQPFAKYELQNAIGRGGMGIVYRARQHLDSLNLIFVNHKVVREASLHEGDKITAGMTVFYVRFLAKN